MKTGIICVTVFQLNPIQYFSNFFSKRCKIWELNSFTPLSLFPSHTCFDWLGTTEISLLLVRAYFAAIFAVILSWPRLLTSGFFVSINLLVIVTNLPFTPTLRPLEISHEPYFVVKSSPILLLPMFTDETLVCHDLVNLPPFQRVTLIHWISEREVVVGIFPNLTVSCVLEYYFSHWTKAVTLS